MQADFSVRTCSICRMQYAPGEPQDEKTHAAYHAAVLTGIRFQVQFDDMVSGPPVERKSGASSQSVSCVMRVAVSILPGTSEAALHGTAAAQLQAALVIRTQARISLGHWSSSRDRSSLRCWICACRVGRQRG